MNFNGFGWILTADSYSAYQNMSIPTFRSIIRPICDGFIIILYSSDIFCHPDLQKNLSFFTLDYRQPDKEGWAKQVGQRRSVEQKNVLGSALGYGLGKTGWAKEVG